MSKLRAIPDEEILKRKRELAKVRCVLVLRPDSFWTSSIFPFLSLYAEFISECSRAGSVCPYRLWETFGLSYLC